MPNPLEEKLAKLEETLAKQADTIKKLEKEKEDEEKETKSLGRKADMKGKFEQAPVSKKPASLIEKSEYDLFDMLSL